MPQRNLAMARRIAALVAAEQGRAYFVGGYVRDKLLGKENKDIDLEIHGVPPERLAALLDSLGERLALGASFGVWGLRHYDLDIAMPRAETAIGRGHKDFTVEVDPFLGEEKAARRRDFTINALMEDVLTGEVLDFFGGREDLRRGLLRHVDAQSFGEDPLRVFRAAQFAARFGFTVAEETVALCGTMPVDALPPERVLGELDKALDKAARPGVFFTELRRMHQLHTWFPALEQADWERAMTTLDRAALRREAAKHPRWLTLTALCAALPLETVPTFLARLTREVRLTDYVLNLCTCLPELGAPDLLPLLDNCLCPEDLLLLAASWTGTPQPRLQAALTRYQTLLQTPPLQGRDLLQAHYPPSPQYTPALHAARQSWLRGESREEQFIAAAKVLGKGITED